MKCAIPSIHYRKSFVHGHTGSFEDFRDFLHLDTRETSIYDISPPWPTEATRMPIWASQSAETVGSQTFISRQGKGKEYLDFQQDRDGHGQN